MATSCNSSPQAPCHPTGLQQASRMLPAQLLYLEGRVWDWQCSAWHTVPMVPMHQQLTSQQQRLKDVRKEKAIACEKCSTGSPDRFWPSQILLHSPWEQFVSWTDSSWWSRAYQAIIPSEIVPAVSICHGAIHFLSSCFGMLRHAGKQLSSLTHEVAAWQWQVKAIPGQAPCPCLGLENALGFLGGEQCYVTVQS